MVSIPSSHKPTQASTVMDVDSPHKHTQASTLMDVENPKDFLR